jgi:hypothetical protein
LIWASDLSGGSGTVLITTDPSGVKVTGDPIVFGNLVYFTSTINLVPVSTIVDTDIFSSNAYFSTMSSGNISTGNIRATNAAISSLFVSSITAGDISGYKPSDWSLYPTLNSSITFNAGTQNILSNVGNKLYFAGNEITDLSGGGANWSAFPAQQDVSMNNFSIRALSTLQYNDGARLYSQTGNNLFYNGQPIYYGNQGSAANWSFYPASTNVVMTNYGLTSASRLPFAAPQVSTVVDQGLNLTSVASYDVTVQNGNRGVINLTANGGNNNGIFGSINLTANGATLSGVGATGGLITLTANTPTGTPCNATSAIKFSAAGINSYAGAIPSVASLAGYNFIYGNAGVNIASGIPSVFPNIPLTTYLYGTAGVTTESTFYVPQILPYWNGVTTPPDLVISGRYIAPNLAQVYLQLSNVKYLYMDGAAQIQNVNLLNFSNATGQITNLSTINGIPLAQIQNQSNIVASNVTATISVNTAVVNTQSTITNTLYVSQQSQMSTVLWNFALGLSSVFNNIAVNNIKIADDITGVTNAPMPLQSRLLNFSTVNSFNVSTTDLWVSSINGQPIDISGSPFVNTNTFSTLFTSSAQVSTLVAPGFTGQKNMNITADSITFQGTSVGNPESYLSSLSGIYSPNRNFEIRAGGEFDLLYYPGGANYVRIGGGSAYDTKIRDLQGAGAVSTQTVMCSTIIGDPVGGLDISGEINTNNTINIPLANGGINFDDGSFVNYTRMMRRDIANNNMLSVVNTTGLASNSMDRLGVGELWLTGGADQYEAVRMYSVFPYGNYELDAIDANGTTLFAYIQGYYNGLGLNPGYVQAYSNVSSISGYNENSASNPYLNVIGSISTGNLNISSINGLPIDGGTFDNQFSTIFTSSLAFSTLYSSTATTNFYYPIFIDHESDGPTAGAAIAIRGHDSNTGAVIHQIEMGWRASDGANYLQAVWPGHNLEDLSIEGDPVKITDGAVSTIFNQAPYALQTTGGVAIGQGSGIITLSTGLLKVGGQTNLTPFEISTTFINTPYGNNLYYAGHQQPCIFHGTVTLPSGGGVTSTLVSLPTNYTTKDFDVNLTYKDQYDNSGLHWSTQTAGSFLAFGGSSNILSWASFGSLPFTG